MAETRSFDNTDVVKNWHALVLSFQSGNPRKANMYLWADLALEIDSLPPVTCARVGTPIFA